MKQTQTERKHTPLPWRIEYHKSHLYGDFKNIIGADGKRVCDRNDAEFKICACNSHYRLVTAIHGLLYLADATAHFVGTQEYNKARAALADVE